MFIGHYGVALGAHAIYPQVPLPVLAVATQAIDVVWAGLVLGKVEDVEIKPGATATTPLDLHHMPYSHSLGGAVFISLGMMFLAMAFGVTGGMPWVIFAVAFSHWLLDLLVHDRTLVIMPGWSKTGFGLWNNRPASVALEFGIIGVGLMMYWQAFGPLTGATAAVFGVLAAAGVIVQAGTFFGPAPKSKTALCVTMLVIFALFTLGAVWLDQS